MRPFPAKRLALVMSIAAVIGMTTCLVQAADASEKHAQVVAEVTTQLPRSVRPLHYAVEVRPKAKSLSFEGKVQIDVEVLEPVSIIVLNALDLEFNSVTLRTADGAELKPKVEIDADAQTASFQFAQALPTGRSTLRIGYRGKIGTQANGLFALDYATPAGTRRGLFTQFENSDARRFIPCWDEPNHKATFDLAVIAPKADLVVSNMPQRAEQAMPDGLRRVEFQTSPKMSTYLLFLAVGEFERATLTAEGGTEVGVVVQKGKLEQARYALEASRDLLREYNDYFGTPYPLPKLDNVGAPGRSQFFGAMENWGAIFTFEHTLLFDPAISGQAEHQRIFGVAAHEIAHQWFGNLVTMAWWDDLWLNEGFASWMGGRTTRKLHPEWDADGVAAAYTSRRAMARDALRTTHPVVQHVATVEQASQAFDGITYGKGAAVISMLEDYVGADAWRSGVRNYVRKRAYANAVTDDLWREIDAVAGGRQFLAIAHDFTRQPGVPLVKADARCLEGHTHLSLEQAEYSIDQAGKAPLRWHVPVQVRMGAGERQGLLLDGKAELDLLGCDAPVVVNAGQKGYFRTLYAPGLFGRLGAGLDRLEVVDQLGVLMDADALAEVGLQPDSDLLGLIERIPLDASADLWQTAAHILTALDKLHDGNTAQRAFRHFAVGRLMPKLERLGWEGKADDSAASKELRADLIEALSQFGEDKVIAEARRRFAASESKPEAMPADLRATLLAVVARHADAATWDKLHRMAQKETSALVRDRYYNLLALALDQALAQRALTLALTDEPGATNAANMIETVGEAHPHLAFDFALAHREAITGLVGAGVLARYFPEIGQFASDAQMIDKIEAYADAHIAPTSRRAAETVIAKIRTAITQREHRVPRIEAWLAQHADP